jgi:hypothetical protein
MIPVNSEAATPHASRDAQDPLVANPDARVIAMTMCAGARTSVSATASRSIGVRTTGPAGDVVVTELFPMMCS